MFWNTSNRLYLYNSALKKEFLTDMLKEREILKDMLKENYKHIFYIIDTNYYFKYYLEYSVTNGAGVYAFIENLRYITVTHDISVHIILIRSDRTTKRISKQFKDDIRNHLNAFSKFIHFTVETMKNVYIKLDNNYIYRLTAIPNTDEGSYRIIDKMFDNQPLIRVAGIEFESIVDGIGIRYVLFVQGCPHHCKGCHNEGTWDYTKGYFMPVSKIFKDIIRNPMLNGVTFSGGEPFMQAKSLYYLMNELKSYYTSCNREFNFTVYTGFTLNQLKVLAETDVWISKLLNGIDYLVDGKFEMDKKSLTCKFRGSTNQKMYKRDYINGESVFTEIFPVE